MSLVEEFLGYLRAQVGRSLYVWGAQGETDITEAWIIRREGGNEANVKRVIALWEQLRAKGAKDIAAYDCSGLVMHFVEDMKGLSAGDMSAAGLFHECSALNRYDMAPGDLVFRHNGERIHHVGVYAGDGMVIEAKGRGDGVVCREIDASGAGYWNRFGRLKLLHAAAKEDPSGARFARCLGGSVNVREGPSTAHRIITVAHRGDMLLALRATDGWSEIAANVGGKLASGFMKDDYIGAIREEGNA